MHHCIMILYTGNQCNIVSLVVRYNSHPLQMQLQLQLQCNMDGVYTLSHSLNELVSGLECNDMQAV